MCIWRNESSMLALSVEGESIDQIWNKIMKSENSYECDFAAEEWDIVGPSIPIRSIINEKKHGHGLSGSFCINSYI